MRRAQCQFLLDVQEALGVKPRKFNAQWLINKPTMEHFGERYGSAMAVFRALRGDPIGLEEKRKKRLTPDAYLPAPYNCLIEFDEVQHFTRFKQAALNRYPRDY